MDYFAEKLLERKLKEEVLGKNYDGNNHFLFITDFDNDGSGTITLENKEDGTERYQIVKEKILERNWDKYEVKNKRSHRYEIPLSEVLDKKTNVNSIKFKNLFAFNQIMIKCKKDENGYYIIPDFLKSQFRKEFPGIKNKAQICELEFYKYTGEYPAYCAGDTIFKAGNTIIKTTILPRKTIPIAFKGLEKEILEIPFIKNQSEYNYCCGGCD